MEVSTLHTLLEGLMSARGLLVASWGSPWNPCTRSLGMVALQPSSLPRQGTGWVWLPQ